MVMVESSMTRERRWMVQTNAFPHTLLLLVIWEKFGHHLADLISRPKFSWRKSTHGRKRSPMDSSQSLDAQPAVFLTGDSNRGDESWGPDHFFAIQVALIIWCFLSFHLLGDGINCQFLEGLFPIHRFYHLFYFQIAFVSSNKVGKEITDSHPSTSW